MNLNVPVELQGGNGLPGPEHDRCAVGVHRAVCSQERPVHQATVSKQELYSFFRELARPFDPNRPPAPPTPDEMQQLFGVAEKYEYWLASPDENAAIGISLQ